MKITVKHKDILTGQLSNTPVNEYLVYLLDDNNQALECKIAYGDADLKNKINYFKKNDIEIVEYIPLDDFKINTDNLVNEYE